MATATSDIAKLGGAAASRVRKDGHVDVRSVGPKASYRAVKALVNASEYLAQDDDAPAERWLALQISREALEVPVPESEPARRTLFLLSARPRRRPPTSPEARNLIVSAQTNAGKAAAAMASAMRPAEGSQARVLAMGTEAVYQALFSVQMAQAYLDNDGRGVRFVVFAAFEEVELRQKRAKQLVLRMVRVSE